MDKPKKPKTNAQFNKMANKLAVGDKVNVYSLIGCIDFHSVQTIKHIGPMHSGKLQMIWFEEGGMGAWHPGAVEKIKAANSEVTNVEV